MNCPQRTTLSSFYKNKKVLVTGHTGFKGAWLCTLLKDLGAEILGFSLPPPSQPNLFDALKLRDKMKSIFGDICDISHVQEIFNAYQPEIVFHLAAQALVRPSYFDPIKTFHTNVLGSVHVLEACRSCPSVKKIIVITSDKCYENNEWVWGYRENDILGGKDPYSASKACTELVVKSYHHAFFSKEQHIRMATARGGNVIGGGDWAEERLVPDILKAIINNAPLVLRNPNATRPWQHILDLAYGYLLLGSKLDCEGYEGAWNFGPAQTNEVTVHKLANDFLNFWEADIPIDIKPQAFSEATFLRLDSSKAKKMLGWSTALDLSLSLDLTTKWYKTFYKNSELIHDVVQQQIKDYWKILK